MSTTTNKMEVISKGSFEAAELEGRSSSIGRPPSSRSTTSQSVRSESQLSLEFLPPEAPHYASTLEAPSLLPSEYQQTAVEPKSITTAELYDRVHQLSEQIKTELGNLEDVESLDSSRPTPLPEGPGREVEMVSDLGGQRSTLSTPQLNESLDEMTSNKDTQEADSSGSDEDTKSGAHNDGTTVVASGRNSELPSSDHQADKESDPNARHFTDPKLQKAFEKMKKLDAKLADLTKKEKEVKRQRHLLEQESAACMALVPTEESEDVLSPSPVFATQLEENTITAGSERVQKCESSSTGENVNETCEGKEHRKNSHKAKPGPHPHGGTDYIQRNIELASEAGALVAMTDGEKKRLQELLEDNTGFEDPYVAPLQLQAVSGGGFTYSKQEEEKMRDIESRLQALMPPEQWESICSSSSRHSTPSMPLTAEYEPSEDSVLLSELSMVDTSKHIIPGEEVLQQFQISREESQRLRDIEERLAAIQEEKTQELELQPSLPASDLAALLEQCKEDASLLDTADQTSNVTEHTTVECST